MTKKAQEWLAENYPDTSITELNISSKELVGELNFSNYPQLEELNYSVNKLTKLDLSNCVKLRKIKCSFNQLTTIIWPNQLAYLTELDISYNKLSGQPTFLTKMPNLQGLYISGNSFTSLGNYLSYCPQLKWLGATKNNLIGSLIIRDMPELSRISLNRNSFLSELQLINCPNLTVIDCSYNSLASLNFLATENIVHLNVRDNLLSQTLTCFTSLVNLEELYLEKTDFSGSLAPLGNLTKLKVLDVGNTKLDSDIELLPAQLETVYAKNMPNIEEKMKGFDNWQISYNYQAWRAANQNLVPNTPAQAEPTSTTKTKTKELVTQTIQPKHDILTQQPVQAHTNTETKKPEKPSQQANAFNAVQIVPSIQPHFLSNDKLAETDTIEEISYEEITHQNNYAILRNKKRIPQLPLRLFDIEKFADENYESGEEITKNIKELKEYVEEVKGRADVKNYATLSYVWGKVENEEELTSLGRKSLAKAIEACSLLKIDYLWIDQLCINQKDREEKAEEVRKMRRCYGDSTVTLVSINTKLAENKNNLVEILKTILKSEWFSRSWTFQEGWLSKQTIFMFDDCLVDGRSVATTWVLHQPQYSEVKFDKSEERTKKIATPLGWIHYNEEFDSEDTVILTLSQALREIESRKRGIPVDGIYSILGLLPYGENVKVEYKAKVQDGNHPLYFKDDVEKALLEVMKEAIKAGYGEPLAWFGSNYESPKRCWLPAVIFDENTQERQQRQRNGSFRVEGGININYKGNQDINQIFNKNDNIKIKCSEYVIDGSVSNLSKWDEGFIISTGASDGYITVKTENNGKYDLSLIKVQGTENSLRKLNKHHVLLIPNKAEWESDTPFAILAERKRGRVFHRIGLVKILEGTEKLSNDEQREIMLGGWAENDNQLTEQCFADYESCIEVAPKN